MRWSGWPFDRIVDEIYYVFGYDYNLCETMGTLSAFTVTSRLHWQLKILMNERSMVRTVAVWRRHLPPSRFNATHEITNNSSTDKLIFHPN